MLICHLLLGSFFSHFPFIFNLGCRLLIIYVIPVFQIQILYQIQSTNIFSQSVTYLFIFLVVYFKEQKVFTLSPAYHFFFYGSCISCPNKCLLNQETFGNVWDIFDCYNQENATSNLWVQTRDAAKYSAMYRTVPTPNDKKIIQPKVSVVPKLRNTAQFNVTNVFS